MATTYKLISSNTLSASAASVTFSSIPSTYTDLVLRVSARSDSAGVYDSLTIQFNGDTATNYSKLDLRGTGTAAQSGFSANATSAAATYAIDGAGSTATTFSNGEIYIPSYTASQNKQFGSFHVEENNAAAAYMSATANLWRNTAAITSIVLACGGNFVSGSSFYLYGIKNS